MAWYKESKNHSLASRGIKKDRFEYNSWKVGSCRAIAIYDNEKDDIVEDVTVGDIRLGKQVKDLREARRVAKRLTDMVESGEAEIYEGPYGRGIRVRSK